MSIKIITRVIIIKCTVYQAIITSYKFVCGQMCGNITEWGVDVHPGGGAYQNTYTLDLQLWRSSTTVDDSTGTGQYSLVGNNRFTSISLSYQVAIVTPLPQDYGGPEGHSPVDGSRVRTLMIDQSTVDGWTFKPLVIEHQAHSDNRRSMVGHSSLQPLTIEQHAHSDDRRSMVGHSNHQPLTIEQHAHSDDRRSMVGRSYNSPSSGVRTLMIEVGRK